MNKRGLSTVVTTVILIAIAISLITIVWGVVKNIVEEKLESSESCFGVFEKVAINSRYTYYDPSSNEFQFSINIGDIEVDEVLVAISGGGLTKSLTITNEYQQIANLANYGSTGFGTDQIKLPGKNAGLTYVYNMSDFFAKPDSIEIAPTISGTQCGVCDSLFEIEIGEVS